MKVQIPDWHDDGWQKLTGLNAAYDAQSTAEKAVELFIAEAAAYDRIGGEPITVHVTDDNGIITTWSVNTEVTFVCHASQRPTKRNEGNLLTP